MFARRLRLGQVLSRAGVNRSTWARWVAGAEPKKSTLQKVDAALSEMETQ